MGERAAHHRYAHLLAVGVDLAAQVVAREGQGNEGSDRDEAADVAHPVEAFALLVSGGGQEAEGRVGTHDGSAEADVGEQAVDVERVPRVVREGFPAARDGDRDAGALDAAGGHHVAGPRVRDGQDDDAQQVDHHAQEQVPTLAGPLQHVPAVPVEVREQGLAEDDRHVVGPRGVEHLFHVGGELGVERHQRHQQQAAQGGGDRVAHGEQPGELLGESVVAFVLQDDAHHLGDQDEDRHAQYEGGEHQMRLGQGPHEHPAADHGEVAVVGRLERARQQEDQQVDGGEDERDLDDPAADSGQCLGPARALSHAGLLSLRR